MSGVSGSIAGFLTDKQGDLLRILRSHKGKELHVFGSVVRGEDSPDSDIDFLVTLEEGASLFDHIELRRALEAFLGRHVDLVDREALMSDRSGFRSRLCDRILNEATLVCK